MKKLILTSEGIKVIDAPNPNDYLDKFYQPHEGDYQIALEKAIKEGVLFKYRWQVENLILLEQGKLYDIPEGYDVEIRCSGKNCIEDYGCSKDHCNNLNSKDYAILAPKQVTHIPWDKEMESKHDYEKGYPVTPKQEPDKDEKIEYLRLIKK
jgi:hypothetical protein